MAVPRRNIKKGFAHITAMYEFFFLDPECYGLRLFSMFFIAFLGIFLFYSQLQIRGHGYKTGKWLTSKPFLYDMHKNMGRSFEDAVKAEAVVLLPGLALFTFVPSIVFSNFMGWTFSYGLLYAFATSLIFGLVYVQESRKIPFNVDYQPSKTFHGFCALYWILLGTPSWLSIIVLVGTVVKARKLQEQQDRMLFKKETEASVKRLLDYLIPTTSKIKERVDSTMETTDSRNALVKEHSHNQPKRFDGAAVRPSDGQVGPSNELDVKIAADNKDDAAVNQFRNKLRTRFLQKKT